MLQRPWAKEQQILLKLGAAVPDGAVPNEGTSQIAGVCITVTLQ